MTSTTAPTAIGPRHERRAALATTVLTGVPCAARPSTRFRHLDGPCRCFVGGPAPEFPPTLGAEPVPFAS